MGAPAPAATEPPPSLLPLAPHRWGFGSLASVPNLSLTGEQWRRLLSSYYRRRQWRGAKSLGAVVMEEGVSP
ncbi:hypothetical protein PAHAL_6G301100 [Panicum hallii]|uniref:Uncharacterized protein n=1 Tax=Panicum hallii TaxID=206008 RepID=A0A2T8IIF6_9POAL|nr:hypothetical protein PAHAL_6G301100 [Panicum hallii]